MIALVVLAQAADALAYLAATAAGAVDSNPLAANLPPLVMLAVKAAGVAIVIAGLSRLPARWSGFVAGAAVAAGAFGALSGLAVMAP